MTYRKKTTNLSPNPTYSSDLMGTITKICQNAPIQGHKCVASCSLLPNVAKKCSFSVVSINPVCCHTALQAKCACFHCTLLRAACMWLANRVVLSKHMVVFVQPRRYHSCQHNCAALMFDTRCTKHRCRRRHNSRRDMHFPSVFCCTDRTRERRVHAGKSR